MLMGEDKTVMKGKINKQNNNNKKRKKKTYLDYNHGDENPLAYIKICLNEGSKAVKFSSGVIWKILQQLISSLIGHIQSTNVP